MTTKIDKNKRFQVIDYRYDEGIRGRVENNISPTICTKNTEHSLSGNPMILEIEREREELQMQIRKLVPLECLRLMGFERKDYEAMRKIGMSDSAIYHCAGDSIVVPCLIALFSEFFNEQGKHKEIIEQYVERVKQ